MKAGGSADGPGVVAVAMVVVVVVGRVTIRKL